MTPLDQATQWAAQDLPCIQRCAEVPHRKNDPPGYHFMACPAHYHPTYIARLVGLLEREDGWRALAENKEEMIVAQATELALMRPVVKAAKGWARYSGTTGRDGCNPLRNAVQTYQNAVQGGGDVNDPAMVYVCPICDHEVSTGNEEKYRDHMRKTHGAQFASKPPQASAKAED